MADAIFISYRRDDSEGEAGRLFDDLTRAFGSDAVFMDVTGIKPGVDFRHAIEDNVASCGVLLAIVGRTWATITNENGVRRLEDPSDFVALEIASALKREVPVIPVLVHDAKMPAVDLLPESLKSFAYHNSVEITHTRWSSDVTLLIEALKQYVTPKATSETPVHATVPVQLPAPHHPTGNAVPAAAKNWLPMALGALGGIVLIVIIIAYILFKPGPDTNTATTNATPSVTPATQTPASNSPAPSPASTSDASNSPPPASAPAPAKAQAATAVPDPAAQFVGTWKLSSSSTVSNDALGELVISSSGSSLTVHAYGSCQNPSCDWGQQPGVVSDGSLLATFSPPPSGSDTSRTAVVTARLAQTHLDVLVRNTFQNPAGSRTANGHRLLTLAQ